MTDLIELLDQAAEDILAKGREAEDMSVKLDAFKTALSYAERRAKLRPEAAPKKERSHVDVLRARLNGDDGADGGAPKRRGRRPAAAPPTDPLDALDA
jgi:hypothetical protein